MPTTPTRILHNGVKEDGSNTYSIYFDQSPEVAAKIVISKRVLDYYGNDDPTVTVESSAVLGDLLIDSVKDFDKTGHTFMFEHGEVIAEPPLTVPPPMRPIELVLLPGENADHDAEIILTMYRPDKPVKLYTFSLCTMPGIGVAYPHEFFVDLGGCIDLAKPLLDSIRSFYAAGRPDLVEDV